MERNIFEKQRELNDRLNRYRDEYYNRNAPSVSDEVYDRLFDELKELEQETGIQMANSPILPVQSIVFHMKLSVLKSTFSYIHCLCLLKFSPSPMFAAISLLWLLLTSRHSLLLTDFIPCFHQLTRPPLVPHVSFSPYICHIYYS